MAEGEEQNSFYYCFTHSNIGSCTNMSDKLKDLSQGISLEPPSGHRGCFSAPQKVGVRECVVSASHVAVLLEDGSVFRVKYCEELPPLATPRERSDDDGASTSSARSLGSRSASPRPEEREERALHSWGSLLSSGGAQSRGANLVRRGRFWLRRRGSGRAVPRWPVVPATDVPDELVEQALAVLQGKSREAVIRELQRTGLDVNQAVNNLLSRESDDGEEDGSSGVIGFSIPNAAGEELMSLLGSGLVGVGEDEVEEALSRSREEGGGGRDSRISLYELSDPSLQSEIRSLVSLGDGAAGGGASSGATRERRQAASKKKKEPASGPRLFDKDLELWEGSKFTQIAALHSELLAIDDEGKLRGWVWSKAAPTPGPHPFEAELGLGGERITMLSGRGLRASLLTQSGKLATGVDRSVFEGGRRLVSEARHWAELAGETVSQLHTSELITAAITDSGKIFWWGVLPLSERKQALLRCQDKLRSVKHSISSGGGGGESLQPGTAVCIRSCPVYSAGCKAVLVKGAQLECGELLDNVFSCNLAEKARFKTLTGGGRAEGSSSSSSSSTETPADLHGVTLGSKRKLPEDGGTGPREEVWSLRDVVFTEQVQSVKVGTVVKVDGCYVAVHFPALEPHQLLGEARLTNCRLLRKDELVLASESQSYQTPYCLQEPPRRLKVPPRHQLLALACDMKGVHAIFSANSLLHYALYDLNSGRFHQDSKFGELCSQYLLKVGGPLTLIPINISTGVLLDKQGGLYPFSRDSAGNVKDPAMLCVPAVSCVGVGVASARNSLVAVAFKQPRLMASVLCCDVTAIRNTVERYKESPDVLAGMLKERVSGGCNVLHVLATVATPPDPTHSTDKRGLSARTTPRSGILREVMRQSMAMTTGSTPSSSADWEGGEGGEGEEEGRPGDAVDAVGVLSEGVEAKQLLQLMKEKDMRGHTPFMAAVACKAYGVALRLLKLAQSLATEDTLLSMLYPPGCHRDDNPVFVLCRNDTCSFTWTGEVHVAQDIFECRTCSLTNTLCCCTECAYTCHRGHDCSFKRSSPAAYCDCWVKCRCQALAPGNLRLRYTLLCRLLQGTTLGTLINNSKKHLLFMLAAMVTRQCKEQSTSKNLSYRSHGREDMPASDLSPPKFALRALNTVLDDWQCVETALLSGLWDWNGKLCSPPVMFSQSTIIHLDGFTYLLLTRLSPDIVNTLLSFLVRKIQASSGEGVGVEGGDEEGVKPTPTGVAQRFLRSVLRVFTVCQIESFNVHSSAVSSSNRARNVMSSPVVDRVQLILSALSSLAVPQLVALARVVLLPATLGVARPVDSACMSDGRHKVAEEMFCQTPPSLLRVPPLDDDEEEEEEELPAAGVTGGGMAGVGVAIGDADTAESELGDGEESSSGAPPLDASSTATIGSNPVVYLSDQESSDNDDGESLRDDSSLMDTQLEYAAVIPSQPPPPSQQHWALPSSLRHTSSSSRSSRSQQQKSVQSMSMSSALLAQTFSLLMRRLAVTMAALKEHQKSPLPSHVLPVAVDAPERLYRLVWADLEGIWRWLVQSLDMLEDQLRLGSSISRHVKPGKPLSSEALDSRKQFMSFVLTMMRGHHMEHGGALPAIDVAALEHLAWTFDGLHYLLWNTQPVDKPQGCSAAGHQLTEKDVSFFRRSDSVRCLSVVPVTPFEPLAEVLPLAEKPHLLDSASDKAEMFGRSMATLLQDWPEPDCSPLPPPPLAKLLSPFHDVCNRWTPPKYPTKSWLEEEGLMCAPGDNTKEFSSEQMMGWNSHQFMVSVLLGRWSNSVQLFGTSFMGTVGKVPGSFLEVDTLFPAREKEFRVAMDQLHSSVFSELSLEVERPRWLLLPVLFKALNDFVTTHQSRSSPPLCVRKVSVFYSGEPGEGSGVLRSLFTATAEAVLSEENYPLRDPRSKKSSSPSSSGADIPGLRKRKRAASPTAAKKSSGRGKTPVVDSALFYQPGKSGFYSPRVAAPTSERLNAFRNVGRMIGLSLLHAETMPLPLCRHVIKFLLKRSLGWHDLAFLDPVVYESIRQLIVDCREDEDGPKRLAAVGLTFSISLRAEEGGESYDLLPNGSSIPVTPDNILQYTQLYAEHRMITVALKPLQEMRQGLYEVLPEKVLTSVTAEDLRLMLCGTQVIDVDVLRGVTVFEDESRKDPELVAKFKAGFWSIVERMTLQEKQELLYFWTSSPVLPANFETAYPPPNITIRPPADHTLPTANTCVSRLYLPFYANKTILRAKLLKAIKTKTFGFV